MPAQRGFNVSSDRPLPNRDIRVISLIGVAHGVSHYYQLAATMLLIVRRGWPQPLPDVGLLMAIFYGVSGVSQTAAGFAVDRFGADPSWPAALLSSAVRSP
jgi:hypothetical protein